MAASRTRRYKYCIVPTCKSSSILTPQKIFLTLPRNGVRRKWCLAMRRRENELSAISGHLICEDHFDLENDMENYIRYKLQGGKIFLKKDVVPHIFSWTKRPSTEKSPRQADLINPKPPTSKMNDDITAEYLKKKWKTLRDYFTRHKKLTLTESPSVYAKRRIDMRRIHRLSFLDVHSVNRSIQPKIEDGSVESLYQDAEDSCGDMSTALAIASASNADAESVYNVATGSNGSCDTSMYPDIELNETDDQLHEAAFEDEFMREEEAKKPPNKKRKYNRTEKTDRIETNGDSGLDKLLEHLQSSRKERHDMFLHLMQEQKAKNHVDIFFESMACTVKTLPPRLVVKAKKFVSEIVFNLEEEALK